MVEIDKPEKLNTTGNIHLQLHHMARIVSDSNRLQKIGMEKGMTNPSDIFLPQNRALLEEAAQVIAQDESIFWGNMADTSYTPQTAEEVVGMAIVGKDANYAAELTGPNGSLREAFAQQRKRVMIERFSIDPESVFILDHKVDDTCLFETQITPAGEPAPHCTLVENPTLKLTRVRSNEFVYTAFSEIAVDENIDENIRALITVGNDFVLLKGAVIGNNEALKVIESKYLEVLRRFRKPRMII